MCINQSDPIVEKVASVLAQDIYNDLAKKAISNIGDILGDITAAIKLVSLPFAILGNQGIKLRQKYTSFLNKTYSNVPCNHQIKPDNSISFPIIQNLIMSFDKEDILEMYSNLLASASDDRSAKKVHPSFPFIISQLGHLDAVILNLLKKDPFIPFLEFQTTVSDFPLTSLEPFSIIPGHELDYYGVSASFNNLQRLGLIRKQAAILRPDSASNSYVNIYNSPIFDGIRDFKPSLYEPFNIKLKGGKLELLQGSFRATNQGLLFLDCCFLNSSK
ncbi:DUF4393 domain-containing protein [uncultured Veillonella sp.]|uniref:DUF4393 domain-containing protein n=1 Tax=uncultured Veillonella sp. TaxID=159268 RepID=UPI0025945479|nr:DUF4393 domain-containing protein [uncultured Veillonella sp.]